MKIKTQLTLATLMAMGLFATGCSQQTAGAGQTVSSAQQTTSQATAQTTAQTSQQAVEGGDVVQEVVTGEEFVTTEEVAPATTVKEVVRTVYDCSKCNRTPPRPVRPNTNKWTHTHPAIPGCTDSVTHSHPYTDRNHKHRYSCKGQRPPVVRPPVRPPVRPNTNKWAHTHPAIPGCTDSITHSHPYTDRNHKHRYSCTSGRRPVTPIPRPIPVPRPIYVPTPVPVPVPQPVIVPEVPPVKAKGNYRGPILMSPQTRDLMQQYQQ